MKVIYHESDEWRCPYLIDGKEYEVEDTIDIEGEPFYMINDEDTDEGWDEPEPYDASMFEVVEE